MAAMLRFRGELCRRIFASTVQLIYPKNVPEFARPCAERVRQWSTVRFLAIKSAHQNAYPETESNATAFQHKRLDRALGRLDMDVRRTGRILLRDVEEIFNEMKSLGSISSTQSLLVIRCCGALLPEEVPEARTKLVDRIWDSLQSLGVCMDVSHYNALLKVYLENEHKFSPTDFLAIMEQKGVEPNRVTYQRLIAHYCQQGDIAGASEILQFMKEKDLPINENVFNALIQGHARANDMDGACSILEVMRNAKLEPSPDTYCRLLCCQAEKGDVEGIQATFKEVEKNEIQLLDRDILEVVFSLAVSGYSKHAIEMLSKLRKTMGYNQDAVNTILRLINRGQDEVAYELLLTMPASKSADGRPLPAGQFFIRQLVKVGRPKEKILSMCNDLKKRGLNMISVLRATEAALVFERIDYAQYFIEALKEQDVPIRPHYFWPILCSHRRNKNEQGIYDTIATMMRLDSQANFDTFLEYVFPSVDIQDPEVVLQKLKAVGHTTGSVVSPLVTYLILQKRLSEAVHLIKNYPTRLLAASLIPPLAFAYHDTRDLERVLDVLVKINLSREQNQKTDWTGQFLIDFLRISNANTESLEPVLLGLKSKGLGISHATSDRIRSLLKEDIPETVTSLLDDLVSSSLDIPLEDEDVPGSVPHPREMSLEELENHYVELKAKNMNTRGILRRLLFQHCRFKNLDRAMQIKADLDACDFVYSPAMYAQLMDLHVAHKQLDKALEFRDLMHQVDPNFAVDDHKILNLAALLVKNGLLEDALKLISEHHKKHGVREKPDTLIGNSWRLLNAAAEQGDVQGVQRLFDCIYKSGFTVPVNTVLGPLVKAHLQKDDLSGALEEYERCCKTFHSTPWKNELFLRLIKLEDAERLQKVVDLSTEVHGEMNTMYDLAFAFIDCGQVKQARKILETPGLRARHQRLDAMCEKYVENDRVVQLEHLVSITKDLFEIDRDRMYYHLLRAYVKLGDVEKALGVWTSMQEESIQPSDRTLCYLADFLASKGKSVPFAVPKQIEESSKEDTKNVFINLVKKGDVDGALDFKRSSQQPLSIPNYSALVELLLHKDRLNEAVSITKEMLVQQKLPSSHVLRYLFTRLASSGDVDSIDYIGQSVRESMKRSIGFNNLMASAYLNSERHLELLDTLEKGCPDNQNDVPNGGLLGLLKNHHELSDRVEKLARRYAEHNFLAPLNMVWMHYFIRRDFDKANEIFLSMPAFQEKLLFLNVIKEAKLQKDESMLQKLTEVLRPTKLNLRTKGVIYSATIDVLCDKENFDGAVKIYEEANSHGLAVSDFNSRALHRLKNGLEKSGKSVPFSISSQEDSSSSDSESSGDERK